MILTQLAIEHKPKTAPMIAVVVLLLSNSRPLQELGLQFKRRWLTPGHWLLLRHKATVSVPFTAWLPPTGQL